MKAKRRQMLYLILGVLGLAFAVAAKFLPAGILDHTQTSAVIELHPNC